MLEPDVIKEIIKERQVEYKAEAIKLLQEINFLDMCKKHDLGCHYPSHLIDCQNKNNQSCVYQNALDLLIKAVKATLYV